MSTNDPTWRAWVEVDLGALGRNYETIRRAVPSAAILPIVKADGYGLGARRVVAALEPLAPWGYGVATFEEGAELRALGIERPILVFFAPHDALAAIAEARLTPALGDLEGLARWRAIARTLERRLTFHLEVDTGMGRAGFACGAASDWLPAVLEAAERDLEWEGIFTHFHSGDRPASDDSVREQWHLFESVCRRIPERRLPMRHAVASAALLRYPEYAGDLVRPGIFLYGGAAGAGVPEPEPVATVRARVLSIREVPEGWPASYGATYRARGQERWATLGIGYADGYPRSLSNCGTVLLDDGAAPVIGRVCMDVIVVEISRLARVQVGSLATVIGGPADSPAALDRVAERSGTISYEILTGLAPRLPRLYRE